MALTKLPGSRWWIETDDITYDIIGMYNKDQITADIQAINATLDLPQYPKPRQVDNDIVDLLAAIENRWTVDKRERIRQLISIMYSDYKGGDWNYIEAAQLIARRDALIALRDRLV